MGIHSLNKSGLYAYLASRTSPKRRKGKLNKYLLSIPGLEQRGTDDAIQFNSAEVEPKTKDDCPTNQHSTNTVSSAVESATTTGKKKEL